MAFELPLPRTRKAEGWKAKIRDKERTEPPHVTVLFRTKAWRIGLRDMKFLDGDPPPKEVPDDVVAAIRSARVQLVEAWNEMYPKNSV